MGNINSSELRKRVLTALKGKHDVLPTLAPEGDIKTFPSDLTKLNETQVRQHMSYWKARSGYCNTLLASYEVDVVDYGQRLKDFERRYKFNNKPEKATPMWEIEAGMADDPLHQRLVLDHQQAKALVVMLKAERDNASEFFVACSRELTARVSERDAESRGGAG